MKSFTKFFMIVFLVCATRIASGQGTDSNGEITLTTWQLKSSVLENHDGEEISTGRFTTAGWYPVRVPTTVLGGLVADGVYPDPRVDMNNYLIPDISDSFNIKNDLSRYSYLPDHSNPWIKPYWFVAKFDVPSVEEGSRAWLHFDGINYRGEVWLNGKKISDSSEMVGMFKRFRYDVSGAIHYGGSNYLAVKIYPVDHPGTPGTQLKVFGDTRGPDEDIFRDETLKISGGWDCALPARDRNMGIFRKVYLTFTGDVDIINPYVVTTLPLPDTTSANVSLTVTLSNHGSDAATGLLKGEIDLITKVDMGDYIKHFKGEMKPVRFERAVTVPANGSVTLTSRDFPLLEIKNPHLWWPNGSGEQYLHNLKLSFVVDGKTSAVKNTIFGIREVGSRVVALDGHHGRVFYLNGRRIFCRGGWLQPDMLLDNSSKDVYDQARLIADANMNVVSSEDMPAPSEDFMEALDKYGLMWWDVFYQCYVTVPGTGDSDNPIDHRLAKESVKDIILRYRNDPSLVAWCAANESLPDSDLYFSLKEQLKELDTTRVFLASTGIWWDWKKYSPYVAEDLPVGTTDNGTPDYTWYPLPYYFNKIDEIKQNMFHNELGMDAVPTLGSLKKFIFKLGTAPADSLFPLDSVWAEHGAWDGGGYAFKAYYYAIKNYYGFENGSVSDFCRAAQLVNADNYRAMYEAANARMWDITSGTMIWKLNASYPDFAWEMYDWYLNPNSSYYYVKRACEPVHIQLDANNYEVDVINNFQMSIPSVTVRVIVYDSNLDVKWDRSENLNVGADRYRKVLDVPRLSGLTPVYFVRLELLDAAGKTLSSNLYWESSKTPADYATMSDSAASIAQTFWESSSSKPLFSGLSKFENLKLHLSYKVREANDEYLVRVTVKNRTGRLAIMNRLAIVRRSDNQEVLPTFWSDNFFWLFPGEQKSFDAIFAKKDLHGSGFSVVLDDNM